METLSALETLNLASNGWTRVDFSGEELIGLKSLRHLLLGYNRLGSTGTNEANFRSQDPPTPTII